VRLGVGLKLRLVPVIDELNQDILVQVRELGVNWPCCSRHLVECWLSFTGGRTSGCSQVHALVLAGH
jgi:hypothetical protein